MSVLVAVGSPAWRFHALFAIDVSAAAVGSSCCWQQLLLHVLVEALPHTWERPSGGGVPRSSLERALLSAFEMPSKKPI